MKVLKPGRGGPSWETECTGAGNAGIGCGATLLVEADDVYLTARDVMGRDYTEYATFKCPECGAQTDITSTDYPSKHPSAMQIARRNGRRS